MKNVRNLKMSIAYISMIAAIAAVSVALVLYARKVSQRRIVASIPGIAVPMCEYRCGKITGIYVGGEVFDGAGASKLSQLRSLEELQLDYTGISDRDLIVLTELPRLKTLWLYDKKVSDEGIEIISRLKHLRTLSLRLHQVSSFAFKKLARVKQLRRLEVNIEKLDNLAVDFVASELPNCEILRVDDAE